MDLVPGGGWRLRVEDLQVIKSYANGATYLIDASEAPKPARRYVADVAWFNRRPDRSVLYFGQLRLDGGLRSVVAVTVSPHTAGKILRETREAVRVSIGILERAGVEPLEAAPLHEEPDQAVTLRANIMAIAVQQLEAVLDFLNVSPAEARKIGKTGYLEIDPIVRVELSTALLVGLMGEMSVHEGSFPKEDA